jgi:RimJ/RimL family protein N-acetyltransferase
VLHINQWVTVVSVEVGCNEAVKALSKYSIDFLGLKKIEAGCYDYNVGSLRIFLKSGFVVEGFKRAHIERDGKRLGCFTFGLLANEIK